MGNVTKYNYNICQEICEEVANGKNIKTVLNSNKTKYPSFPTWCKWKRENEELLNLYTGSIQDKAESVDEEIDGIMADIRSGIIDPSSGRILIDTLKWKAAKYYPKMFGDNSKVDVTSGGEKITSTTPEIIVNVIPPKDI